MSAAAGRARDAAEDSKILEVKNSLSRNWTAAGASKFFGLPPKRLDALFKRRFFATFSKTLLAWRMDEARRILSAPGATHFRNSGKGRVRRRVLLFKGVKRHFGRPPGELRGK